MAIQQMQNYLTSSYKSKSHAMEIAITNASTKMQQEPQAIEYRPNIKFTSQHPPIHNLIVDLV